ncbi:MAG: TrbC/VirB2 family protein, partial [Pseudomonadota bacterium]|nr:TrbC/VirB2 family protein [Pseudomonadota bacterium]
MSAKIPASTKPERNLDTAWRFTSLFIMSGITYLLTIDPAFAGWILPSSWDPGTLICNLGIMTGSSIARGLATMGIVAVGASAMFGRITWTTAVIVCVAAGGIVNAGRIVNTLGGV